MTLWTRIQVTDIGHVGEARRVAAGMAVRLGLDATDAGRVALVVNEAATNLSKHAVGGELLLHPISGSGRALEILALDRGPGIPDVGQALVDGFSTSGTLGSGLGAMRRLSDDFDLYSDNERGTAVLLRIRPKKAPGAAALLDVAGIDLPIEGETVSGDQWCVEGKNGVISICLADGLGHGWEAAQAAEQMVSVFRQNPGQSPGQVIELGHAALKATRGAAVAVARIDLLANTLEYAGIGNIAAAIVDGPSARSLVSLDGIVGDSLRKVREGAYPFPPLGLLIMHSDGLLSRWGMDRYPGLARRDPALIAGVLYRDFGRHGWDDISVVVARRRPAAGASMAE